MNSCGNLAGSGSFSMACLATVSPWAHLIPESMFTTTVGVCRWEAGLESVVYSFVFFWLVGLRLSWPGNNDDVALWLRLRLR